MYRVAFIRADRMLHHRPTSGLWKLHHSGEQPDERQHWAGSVNEVIVADCPELFLVLVGSIYTGNADHMPDVHSAFRPLVAEHFQM